MSNERTSIKLVLWGSQASGKTQLTNRFTKNIFKETHESTVGAQFFLKALHANKISLQIWDCSGNEDYNSLIPKYFFDANAIGIVFTLNENSQVDEESLTKQFNKIKEQYPDPKTRPPIYYIVNKIDLWQLDVDKAQVTAQIQAIIGTEEEEELSEFIFLCSAKTDEGVEDAFQAMEMGGLNHLSIEVDPQLNQDKSHLELPKKPAKSFDKLWVGINVLLIVAAIIIGGLALAGIGVAAGAAFPPLAIAGIMVSTAFLLWNIGCGIVEYIKPKNDAIVEREVFNNPEKLPKEALQVTENNLLQKNTKKDNISKDKKDDYESSIEIPSSDSDEETSNMDEVNTQDDYKFVIPSNDTDEETSQEIFDFEQNNVNESNTKEPSTEEDQESSSESSLEIPFFDKNNDENKSDLFGSPLRKNKNQEDSNETLETLSPQGRLNYYKTGKFNN